MLIRRVFPSVQSSRYATWRWARRKPILFLGRGTAIPTATSFRTNLQFVGENAQTIDCRCFHSKDDWAESNWLTSVTARECKFSRREIAFWPNEHQDTARTMLMLGRIARKNLL